MEWEEGLKKAKVIIKENEQDKLVETLRKNPPKRAPQRRLYRGKGHKIEKRERR